MSDYKREEYEQSEEVRKWLKDNMQTLVAGVVGGLALLYGWQFFQKWQAEQQQAAGEAYYRFAQAAEKRQLEQAKAALKAMQQDFPRSLYTELATLVQARLQVADDPAEALALLEPLLEKGNEDFHNLLAVRVARLQWQKGDAQKALDTLAGIRDEAWISLVAEVEGDIHGSQGNVDAARTAYRKALEHLDPTRAGSRPLLEMKLDNLGEADDQPVDEPEQAS